MWYEEAMADKVKGITDLVLAVFRLNGRLIEAGDRLVKDLGLTSARWQVIGAVALAPQPLPVAQIARQMGLTRQAVQRIANELEEDGLVRFAPNPHHRRAKLVVLTRHGHTAFSAAMERQTPWAAALGKAIPNQMLGDTIEVIRIITGRLISDTPIDKDTNA